MMGIWNLVTDSVSSGSKLEVQFRVQIGTELELLQQVSNYQKTEPHRTSGVSAGSTLSHTQNFGSIYVFEFWWYHNMICTEKMQF